MYDFLLVLGLVHWGVCACWFLTRPQASAFHPAAHYLLVHGVLFAIRPVLAWWLGYNQLYEVIGFHPSMSEKITVLLCADLALVVFLFVSLRCGNLPMVRASLIERGRPPTFDRSMVIMVLLCVPLAVVILVGKIGASGLGLSTMIVDMDTGMVMNTSGNGYVNDAPLMLWSVAALIAWVGRFRLWSLVPLVAFIVAGSATGGRYAIVVAVIAVALFYLYEKKQRWPRWQWLVVALPLLALFTVLGGDRGSFVRTWFGLTGAGDDVQYFSSRPLESMDYGNLEFFEYIVHTVPAKSGRYDLFTSNTRMLVEPVPRVLWPGKPHGALISRVQLWRYGTSVGATNSVPGQGWLDAGWLGVIVWAAFFGALFGKIYNLFVASDQNRYKTAFFILFTATCIQCFRDGALLTAVKIAFFPLLPVWIWSGMSWLFPTAPPAVSRRGRDDDHDSNLIGESLAEQR